jgi:hypothetical protein
MLRLDTSTVEELALRLFTNDVTPDRGSVTADFQEATFGGYSQRLLPRAGYGAAVVELHAARMTLAGDAFEWTPTTAGQVLRGAFVVGQGSNNLYAARRFATPRTTVIGELLRLFPVWTLRTVEVA